ncbi:hypothetical protein [Azospirillum sp.]|uniref:hypothetical protein n=1 Tax=Azospirillum sp. TaxID=34012 RepID=UPI003D708DE7
MDTIALCTGYAVMAVGATAALIGIGWVLIEFSVKRLGWTAEVIRFAADRARKRMARSPVSPNTGGGE